MEGVSRIYVDELGETNDDKRLKDNFSLFAVFLFTWFRNVDVCLLRQASASSARGGASRPGPKFKVRRFMNALRFPPANFWKSFGSFIEGVPSPS
jgi:hypothetical protein